MVTDPLVVVPLLLLALLVFVAVVLIRRASGALDASRKVQRFQHDAEALGARMDNLLSAFVGRVDLVRRRDLEPGEIVDEAHSTLDELEHGRDETLGIETPPGFAASRTGMAEELERAMRATEMVIHGCELATGPQNRERNSEAHTAVKRGYLNLLHARERLAEHVADLAGARDPTSRSWRTSRVTRV